MATDKRPDVASIFIIVRPASSHVGWYEARVISGWRNDPDYRDDFPAAYGRTPQMAKALALQAYLDVILTEARINLGEELAKAAPPS